VNRPIIHEGNDVVFYGEQMAAEEEGPFLGMGQDDLRAWCQGVFAELVASKQPETERLRRCSRFYEGFHYKHSWMNKTRPITNYCHSVVETVVPQLTEMKPRPEIVPRQPARSVDSVKRLQRYASWLQSRASFDMWNILATRDASIYGWAPSIVSFDYRTGMPYPQNISSFDLYMDAAANSFEQAEVVAIGTPVSTQKLRANYPEHAKRGLIIPDGIASPSFEACEQPWFENMEGTGAGQLPTTITAAVSRVEGGPVTGQTAWYTPTPEGAPYAATTFLIQLLVRDSSEKKCSWVGYEDRLGQDGESFRVAGAHRVVDHPCCENGWRLITMTYSGAILENCPVEPFFPVKMLRRYPRVDRRWSLGDLDNVIPVQRQILMRDYLLMRGLELQGNPPLLTDTNSGLAADKDTIEGGEVLRLARGSTAQWLEARGPSEHQFEMRMMNSRDIDTIGGVHDVSQGQRPAGIEAASAIRSLQSAAAIRFRGFEVIAHMHRADMLKSLMIGAAKKLQRRIYFMAGGEQSWVDPEELEMEYDIDFAQGTGNAPAKQEIEERAFLLFDRGVLDEDSLLQAVDWMGREEVLSKLAQRAKFAMASGGGEPNGSSGKKPATNGKRG
jgi:hypothetical protein